MSSSPNIPPVIEKFAGTVGEDTKAWASYIKTIQSGHTNIPERLVDFDIEDCDVVVVADSGNTGNILLCGNIGVVTGGVKLTKGQSYGLRCRNTNLIYIAGDTVGDKINVLYSGGLFGNLTARLDKIASLLERLVNRCGA